MTNKEKFSLNDISRRLNNLSMAGEIVEHENGLYKVQDENHPDITTGWCKALVHVGLAGELAVGLSVFVYNPTGNDSGGIIMGVVE